MCVKLGHAKFSARKSPSQIRKCRALSGILYAVRTFLWDPGLAEHGKHV